MATRAALEELDALANEACTRDQTIERLRRFYEYRKRRFAARAGKIEDDGYERGPGARLPADAAAAAGAAARGALADAKRRAALERGDEPDPAELDLEESRLDI